jgi:hypothetical protein
MQDHLDNALEIINETEKILSSHSKITENTTDFLDSISNALRHITLSTKGYVLVKSNKSTEVPIIQRIFCFSIIRIHLKHFKYSLQTHNSLIAHVDRHNIIKRHNKN